MVTLLQSESLSLLDESVDDEFEEEEEEEESESDDDDELEDSFLERFFLISPSFDWSAFEALKIHKEQSLYE